MKIKIEHLKKSSDSYAGETLIYDEETGSLLGGVQKATLVFSATSPYPKAKLEVLNWSMLAEGIDADIEMAGYGPYCRDIDDMSVKDLKEALQWEAKQRYFTLKELNALKNGKKITVDNHSHTQTFASTDEDFEKSVEMVKESIRQEDLKAKANKLADNFAEGLIKTYKEENNDNEENS